MGVPAGEMKPAIVAAADRRGRSGPGAGGSFRPSMPTNQARICPVSGLASPPFVRRGANARMKTRTRLLMSSWCCVLIGCAPPALAQTAADASPPRQSVDDAWWTGPMLANSAATLPRGHFLVEPYLYDASSSQADGYGSLTYMLYGVSDRFTAGLVPVFGYTRVAGEIGRASCRERV